MKTVRKIILVSLLLCAILLTQSANATVVPAGWGSHDSGTSTFNNVMNSSAMADVEWDIYYDYGTSHQYEGRYIYSYKITNTSAAAFSFFSVEILDAAIANISDLNIDAMTGVAPDQWATVNSPMQSVEATFTSVIGSGQSSAILWFVSTDGPGSGDGALVGMSSGYVFAVGTLPTPVPEPVTVALLGIGSLIGWRRKRRHA